MDNLTTHPLAQQMTTTINTWLVNWDLAAVDIAIFTGLVGSWLALFVALVAMKRIKQQAATSYRMCEKIIHDLHIASSGAIGMGQRIIALEQRISKQRAMNSVDGETARPYLQAVPTQMAEQQNPGVYPKVSEELIDNPFELAKELLRKGTDQAQVAQRCGLSMSETALMALVLNNHHTPNRHALNSRYA